MDTPPFTGDKDVSPDVGASDITSQRRQALPTTYTPDQESILTALVTDGGLRHPYGDPASQANIVQGLHRPRDTDYPLQPF